MAFISLHAKLQLPSSIVVIVTADGMISRVGLMLPPYEAWRSAREGSLSCCVIWITRKFSPPTRASF